MQTNTHVIHMHTYTSHILIGVRVTNMLQCPGLFKIDLHNTWNTDTQQEQVWDKRCQSVCLRVCDSDRQHAKKTYILAPVNDH